MYKQHACSQGANHIICSLSRRGILHHFQGGFANTSVECWFNKETQRLFLNPGHVFKTLRLFYTFGMIYLIG